MSPTFTQLQRIKNPYGFADNLDMDRYTTPTSATTTAGATTTGSVTHDYVVGVRELNPANLTGAQGNWINSHTVYTHGYGFVAAEADVCSGRMPLSVAQHALATDWTTALDRAR